jgi:mannose-6-phosphate isomerase-like protein (cupin superfamily)
MKRVVKFEEGIDVHHLGCLVKRLVHPRTVGSENVAISIAIVEPRQEIITHSHSFEEAYFVVEGKAKMRIDDDEFEVVAWDSVYVPANAQHWTLNTETDKLILICALSPPSEFKD